jgi:catechol 2,3-dioxygenase-like lactoylglutathione lyase family enzyme
VRISFVAGFGPIVRDDHGARSFWADALGIELEEAAPGYWSTDDLAGVRAFALWPLSQAAESCFGGPEWPPDLPMPQAWLELDVESAEAVADAVAELKTNGHRLVRDPRLEPWGQTTARLLSPEGLLVGITYTPWMHTTGTAHADVADAAGPD